MGTGARHLPLQTRAHCGAGAGAAALARLPARRPAGICALRQGPVVSCRKAMGTLSGSREGRCPSGGRGSKLGPWPRTGGEASVSTTKHNMRRATRKRLPDPRWAWPGEGVAGTRPRYWLEVRQQRGRSCSGWVDSSGPAIGLSVRDLSWEAPDLSGNSSSFHPGTRRLQLGTASVLTAPGSSASPGIRGSSHGAAEVTGKPRTRGLKREAAGAECTGLGASGLGPGAKGL